MRIADIIIGPRHRKRLGDIDALARSIDELGLLNPVTVTEDGRLIAGWRRIQACLSLGWQDIAANVVQGTSALSAELAEIDENLQREELTVLERGEHLARRKEIYEEMHPETRQGAQGGGRAGKGTRQRTETETISFSVEAATATGVTPRTIRQEVQIATALADDVKETIRDTDLADSKTELLLLARQTPEEQRAIVDKIVAHQAKTGEVIGVRQAQEGNVYQPVAATVFSHRSVEYYTPTEILSAAREVLGAFDLDPASCAEAQANVQAAKFYTKEDDGLSLPWAGRVWLNPPYGKTGGKSNQQIWAERLVSEYRKGTIPEAILLVKAALGYVWFEDLFRDWPVCFLRSRLSFILEDGDDEGQSKQGTALFYLGPNFAKFAEVFRKYGRIIPNEEKLNATLFG